MIIDLAAVYKFIKLLSTPFDKWEAYKLGIIDEKGNVLKKRRELRTVKERQGWGKFNLLVLRIKKLLEKIPGGASRMGSYAAALYLIKEHTENGEILVEEISEEQLSRELEIYIDYVSKNFELVEEGPVNSAGSGAIDGIGVGPKDKAEPGFTPAQMRKYKRKKKILSRLKR